MPLKARSFRRGLISALAIASGFAALLTPGLAYYPKKGDSSPHHGVREARRSVIQGIDVSRWQGDIDWAKVKDAGTRFAFIKATEGGDHLAPNFRRNWAEAKKAGVPRSAYHFVWWCRPAKDQVRWMKRHIPRDPDALPPVLDVECDLVAPIGADEEVGCGQTAAPMPTFMIEARLPPMIPSIWSCVRPSGR